MHSFITTICYGVILHNCMLLFPGLYFVSHSYDKAGEDHYITVVALNDDTQVLIQKPDEEVFSVLMNAAAPRSNVVTFNLNALESVRYLLVCLSESLL